MLSHCNSAIFGGAPGTTTQFPSLSLLISTPGLSCRQRSIHTHRIIYFPGGMLLIDDNGDRSAQTPPLLRVCRPDFYRSWESPMTHYFLVTSFLCVLWLKTRNSSSQRIVVFDILHVFLFYYTNAFRDLPIETHRSTFASPATIPPRQDRVSATYLVMVVFMRVVVPLKTLKM